MEVIKTILEFVAVILLIVGFINEKKIIAFEIRLAKAIRIHIRNRKLKKKSKCEFQNIQSRAPASEF